MSTAPYCSFCGDGRPHGRYMGRPACDRCLDAFAEGARPILRASTTRALRDAIRKCYPPADREYPVPVFERALRARGSFRP